MGHIGVYIHAPSEVSRTLKKKDTTRNYYAGREVKKISTTEEYYISGLPHPVTLETQRWKWDRKERKWKKDGIKEKTVLIPSMISPFEFLAVQSEDFRVTEDTAYAFIATVSPEGGNSNWCYLWRK